MAEVKTVAIANDDGSDFIVINESDFDPNQHQLWQAEVPQPEPVVSAPASVEERAAQLVQDLTKAELKDKAAELNIAGRSRMSEQELAAAIATAGG